MCNNKQAGNIKHGVIITLSIYIYKLCCKAIIRSIFLLFFSRCEIMQIDVKRLNASITYIAGTWTKPKNCKGVFTKYFFSATNFATSLTKTKKKRLCYIATVIKRNLEHKMLKSLTCKNSFETYKICVRPHWMLICVLKREQVIFKHLKYRKFP